jgi:pimeloyl-CoA synthetase
MKYAIEVLQAGVWELQDEADSVEDALTLASAVCHHPCCTPEQCWDHKLQIIGPDGKPVESA